MQTPERKWDKRVVIYPAYIDKNITVAAGRRVPKTKACEDPNVKEICDCCTGALKLKADFEYKHYSRQWWVPGRVRVQLKNDDGSPCNPQIPDRKTLFLRVAELVPHHPMRSQEALAAKKAAAEQHERQIKAAEKAAAGGSSGGTKPAKSGNKKKNRK